MHSPRAMAVFRPRVVALTDELIDRFVHCGSAELMDELAYALPISVMSEPLAVPVADRQRFLQWDAAISGIQTTGAAEGERALALMPHMYGHTTLRTDSRRWQRRSRSPRREAIAPRPGRQVTRRGDDALV
jgi:cytochrome P450